MIDIPASRLEAARTSRGGRATRRGGRIAAMLAVVLLVLASAVPGGAVTQRAPDGTVLGGAEAQPGAYPFMVALVVAGGDPYWSQFCGGTVIDADWVMTAGHCVDGEGPRDVEVLIGRHDLGVEQGERLGVTEIRIHPGYDDWTAAYDVALLRLRRPTAAAPVRVAGAGWMVTPGAPARVIGWGDTLLSYPFTLRQADVPLVADQECAAFYGADLSLASMVCAGGFYGAGDADACAGDSGGPLLVADGGGWLQVGLVSWGDECSVGTSPGVYGRVSAFSDWITGIVGAGGSGTFTDDDGSVHEADIEAIAAAGITRGCTAAGDRYCPDGVVTRGEMAAFLARGLGLPVGGVAVFSDVAGSQFASEIAAIAAAGITRGCDASGDRYCPDDVVTRAQMASFLARGLGLG